MYERQHGSQVMEGVCEIDDEGPLFAINCSPSGFSIGDFLSLKMMRVDVIEEFQLDHEKQCMVLSHELALRRLPGCFHYCNEGSHSIHPSTPGHGDQSRALHTQYGLLRQGS